jgi:hypothetical protein
MATGVSVADSMRCLLESFVGWADSVLQVLGVHRQRGMSISLPISQRTLLETALLGFLGVALFIRLRVRVDAFRPWWIGVGVVVCFGLLSTLDTAMLAYAVDRLLKIVGVIA